MNMEETGRRAASFIKAQMNVASQLLDLLNREHAALRERRLDDVEALAAEKSNLVSELESLDSQKRQFVEGAIPRSARNVHKALATLEDRLNDSVVQCQRQNQINGAIIAVSQQFSQRALSILRGQQPCDVNSTIYSRDGQAASHGDSQSITKA